MTSLGFEESLNPYEATAADTVCVLKNVQIKTAQLEKNVESTDQHLCNEQEADTTEQPSEAEPKVDTESKEEKIEADEPAAFITELDPFTRIITNITDGCVMGWKYFDFGDDFTGDEDIYAKVHRGAVMANCIFVLTMSRQKLAWQSLSEIALRFAQKCKTSQEDMRFI